jgi:hypothetical protein
MNKPVRINEIRLSCLPLIIIACLGCSQSTGSKINLTSEVSSLVFVKRVLPQNAGNIFAHKRFLPGGNIFLLRPPALGGKLFQLTHMEAGDVLGLDVAPDGKSAVVAIRTDQNDRFHLYRVNLENVIEDQLPCFLEDGDLGINCTRLTFGPSNDTYPFHLPDGRIAFLRADPDGQVDFEGRGRSQVLMAVEPDGSQVSRLGYGPGNVLSAWLEDNGKILVIENSVRNGVQVILSYLIDPAGSMGVKKIDQDYSNWIFPQGAFRNEQDQWIAACVSALGTYGAGYLCQKDSQGNWVNISQEIPEDDSCSPLGRVRDPYPLSDDTFIVSYLHQSLGCANLEDGDRGLMADFGIAIMSKDGTKRTLVYNDPKMAEVFPRPVIARTLVDNNTVLNIRPEENCQESGVEIWGYASDAIRIRALEGISANIAPWAMKIAEIVGGAISAGASLENQVTIFEAPINEDGSYKIRIPSNVPIKLQTIDNYGAVVSSDPIWRGGPNCATRQCAGCHYNNGQLDGFSSSLAAMQDAVDLSSDRDGQKSFDFRRDIQPIFDSSCNSTGCHDSETRAGSYVSLSGNLVGLDLSGNASGTTSVAYRNLLMLDQVRDSHTQEVIQERRPFVVPGLAKESRLIERLGAPCRYECENVEPWASWAAQPGQLHPEDQPQFDGNFSDEQRWQLIEWIDAGAPFYGRGAEP